MSSTARFPARVTVPPGGDVTFTVEVENARDRRVAWEVTPGGHAVVTAGEEKLKATLSTAEDRSRFPVRTARGRRRDVLALWRRPRYEWIPAPRSCSR